MIVSFLGLHTLILFLFRNVVKLDVGVGAETKLSFATIQSVDGGYDQSKNWKVGCSDLSKTERLESPTGPWLENFQGGPIIFRCHIIPPMLSYFDS